MFTEIMCNKYTILYQTKKSFTSSGLCLEQNCVPCLLKTLESLRNKIKMIKSNFNPKTITLSTFLSKGK